MLRPEVALARKLRRALTYPEVLLWQRLRGQATGYKFRKQHPVGCYVTDFCCLSARLIVEVDGADHDASTSQRHDYSRQRFLEENGFRVLRVLATDVQRDLDAVIAAIVALAAVPPPPSCGRSPSPFRGG